MTDEQGTPEVPTGDPAPSTEAPAEAAPTEAAPAADSGPTITFEVDGEQHTVSQADAPKYFLRQQDYTKKTQALAEQREALSEAEALRQALEVDPAATVQVLQDAYGLTETQAQQVADEAQEPLDPEEQRLARLEQTANQWEMSQAEAAVEQEFQQLEGRVGQQNVDRNEVFEHALNNHISIDLAWKDLAYERAFQQREAQRAEEDAKVHEQKQDASFVSGGSSPAAGAVVGGEHEAVSSLRDAYNRAKSSTGQSF